MKIILLQSVRGLGDPGQIVNVKSGYARNYLIPNDLATYATKSSISQAEYQIEKSKELEAKRIAELQEVCTKLNKVSLKFELQTSEEDKLFGSVTPQMICDQLLESGYKIEKKDIATVIGKGGATIREIVEKSGAKVDVNDEGEVTVAAPDEDSRNKAMQMIKDLTAKAELNKIYNGKVMKIMEFGAFVNFLGKQDGLVHISELADKRVAKVTDVVKEGDEVKVKVIGFDRGKVKLSIKQAAV